ncbi:hypothetical protein [Sporosarcina sp. SAFN-015]|uniref:hypothetical protein n=1 Tax=Sporosarcina sp. SAFN-015 TaxID=3387274 RepID=UPI003F7E6AD2
MAKFKTRYSELGFYVDGSLCRFKGGIYVTEDKAEITVLETLADVERVDVPVKTEPKTQAKAEAKPSTKAKAPAKK